MTQGDKRNVSLPLASKFQASKCVGWFVAKTLGIHDQGETLMIGNFEDMGFCIA